MVPFERAMVVPYKLSIVTIALSVTIRPQFVGVGHFGPKFRSVPLGVDPSCWGLVKLTNREIIFKEFQPM